ncbi:MAG: Txe/YoeB family addiction module toxin [Pseudomonadota bacterium]
MKDISRNPKTGEGIGKPERLRFELSGYSSKRINDEHRLVYKIIGKDTLLVLSCRYHYSH